MKTLIVVLLVILPLNVHAGKVRLTKEKYPAVHREDVAILTHAPKRHYQEIGLVSSKGFGNWSSEEDVICDLQKYAAELGADAVIITESGRQTSGVYNTPSNTTGTFQSDGSGNGRYQSQTVHGPGVLIQPAVAKGIAIKY